MPNFTEKFSEQTQKNANKIVKLSYFRDKEPEILSKSQYIKHETAYKTALKKYPDVQNDAFSCPAFTLFRDVQDFHLQTAWRIKAWKHYRQQEESRFIHRSVHSSPRSGMSIEQRRDGTIEVQTKTFNVSSNFLKNRFENAGTRVEQTHINQRGKKRIKTACRILQWEAENRLKRKKRLASFITLTFGRKFPCDQEAKRLLDIWLKRFRRYVHKRQLTGKDKIFGFHYLWVMEVQERGAPHFHILTPHYAWKEFINSSWNEVIRENFYKPMGFEPQTVYPEIAAVKKNIAGYMTKYMSKSEKSGKTAGKRAMKGRIWAISTSTRKLMAATKTTLIKSEGKDMSLLLQYIYEEFKETYPGLKSWKSKYNQTAFIKEAPPFLEILNQWQKLLNLDVQEIEPPPNDQDEYFKHVGKYGYQDKIPLQFF